MRWGAAIAWLVDQGNALLPLSSVTPADDWLFDDWLAANPQLTWQVDLPFVDAPAQSTETVLRLFSPPFDQCGKSWVASGGISNPSMRRVAEIAELRPELPKSLARAGLSSAETDFSTARSAGVIAGLDGIRRTLAPVEPKLAQINVEAKGRKVWSLGEVKVAMPETATRRLDVALSALDGDVQWRMDVQDVPLGELIVKAADGSASVTWRQGPLADLKPMLEQLQDLLLELPLADALELVFDAGATQVDALGERRFVLLGDDEEGATNQQWLAISAEPPADPETLSFRLAVPDGQDEAGLTWRYAYLTEAPGQ